MSSSGKASAAEWINVISDNSTVNIKELCEWLGVKSRRGITALAESDPTFPKPRFGSFMSGNGRGGTPARWRAGDIRAWLKGAAPTPFQLSDNPARPQKERRELQQVRGDVVFVRHRK
ncbi:MAG: helix-turn-helix transcriptional regulator [bacterium]